MDNTRVRVIIMSACIVYRKMGWMTVSCATPYFCSCLFVVDAVLTVAKGKLMADKLLASGGMTKDKSVSDNPPSLPSLLNSHVRPCTSNRDADLLSLQNQYRTHYCLFCQSAVVKMPVLVIMGFAS